MTNFMRRLQLIEPKHKPEEFLHVSADYLAGRFFHDHIEVLPSRDAATRISAHPQCPFYNFAFTGECELDRVWYYIAASGSLNIPTTRVLLLRKDCAE